jgi:hypothetical protein
MSESQRITTKLITGLLSAIIRDNLGMPSKAVEYKNASMRFYKPLQGRGAFEVVFNENTWIRTTVAFALDVGLNGLEATPTLNRTQAPGSHPLLMEEVLLDCLRPIHAYACALRGEHPLPKAIMVEGMPILTFEMGPTGSVELLEVIEF